MQTRRLMTDRAGIEAAAALIADEQLVALPTETVYGLAGDARSGIAVARIFEAKGRPSFNPLIVHVPDTDVARRYAVWSDAAGRLAAAFWPGPLTLVLPLQQACGLSPLVTAGQDSVALRVPAHAAAQALLRATGAPLAAPSANPSGRISPTTCRSCPLGPGGAHRGHSRRRVLRGGGRIDYHQASQTHRRCCAPAACRPKSSRPRLAARLRLPKAGGAITAPGQLSSHYAPAVPVRLEADAAQRMASCCSGSAARRAPRWICRPQGIWSKRRHTSLRTCTRSTRAGPSAIAVAPVPDTGLGRAINDRLRRAAAPR